MHSGIFPSYLWYTAPLLHGHMYIHRVDSQIFTTFSSLAQLKSNVTFNTNTKP